MIREEKLHLLFNSESEALVVFVPQYALAELLAT
jgi:hypothetical protein